MRSLVLVGFLALGTAFGATVPATAAPAPTAIGGLSNGHSGIELAQYKRNRHYKGNRKFRRGHARHHHRHYRRDRYRGWHRYHSRPRHWHSRGCVALGPVWMCP